MDKSHVSLEQKICPVCGKVFDSGAILLDKYMRKSMEMHTTTGFDLCQEHEEMHKKGYIALVVCDESKSKPMGNIMKIEDAYRTGEVIHVKKSALKEIVNVSIESPVMFINVNAAEKIKNMANNQ